MPFHRLLKTSLIGLTLSLLIGTGPINAADPSTASIQAMQRGSVSLFSEDFTGFTGSGFVPMPAAGQLDSDVFRVTGLQDGIGEFGGTQTGNDFARGQSTGGVGGGGIYAFDVGSGNIAWGVQPSGADFTPGTFDIRLINDTAAVISDLDISYSIWVFNDQARGNSLNFSWSLDDSNYTPIGSLDFTSPETADGTPAWQQTPRSTNISGLNIAPNAEIFLRWTGEDALGGGSRDEFGIDDILVSATLAATDILITKQGPAEGLAGQPLTYTIQIQNPSQTDALDNLILTDTLPADLSYVSDTSGITPVITGSDIEWSFGSLAAAGSISFELTVDSDIGIADETILTNSVLAEAELNASPVSASTGFDTVFRALVTIPEIQEVPNPGTNDASPLLGQRVWTEGIVTAAPGELSDSDGDFMVIQDTAGGPWSGLAVRADFSGLAIERGDTVRLLGEVSEPFNLTQLINGEQLEITGTAPLPVPEVLATSAFPEADTAADVSEQWEGVLIEFQTVEVTQELGFSEWQFDDGPEGNDIARGDDLGSITFTPQTSDAYGFLRGIGWFSFSNYKLQPRDNLDIDFELAPLAITTIQGTGLRSPFASPDPDDNSPGDLVRTLGNVVTAVASNGFFIQQPDAAPDPFRGLPPGPTASRGLFVFTGSAPTAQVGDIVDVQGQVLEFFNLTQIANPDFVNIIPGEAALPAPIMLDANTPSQDPANLSCIDTQFECYESMLVSIADGFVTAPSQSFGSAPVAEAFISTDGERILRAEGAEFPGIDTCATCPVWSGAPELFEMDPRRFDLRNEPLIGGTTFNASGVMGFSFGDYVFWPTELNIVSEPSLPDPVAVSDAGQLTIGSLNALNLFDDIVSAPRPITVCGSSDNAEDREVLSTTDYETKLNKLAVYIVTGLGGPDVLALQEVESAIVLQDLADEIANIEPALVYTPELVFGNDRGNINNGFLINTARIANDYTVEQLAEEECLTVDGSPLHDRPPLLLRGRFIGEGLDTQFAVFNNHLRSLGGIDNQDGRTRLKRHEQAQSTATQVQNLQTAEPDLPIIVIGDINAFEFSDGFADVVGHLRGTANPAQNLVSQENVNNNDFNDDNIPDPPLALPLLDLPQAERYSFIFRGISQTLDHALLNNTAENLFESLSYSRANADYWEGFEFEIKTEAYSSDHDGLVVTLNPDRLFADSFETN